MATKYAGQNALNKLMSLIKNAIPTKNSQLTNDSRFVKQGYFEAGDNLHVELNMFQDGEGDPEYKVKYSVTGMPTKTSDLTNDSGFITSEDLDGKAPYVVTVNVTSGSSSATVSDTRDNIKAKLDANIPVVGYIIVDSGQQVWGASVSWGGASIIMTVLARDNDRTWYGQVDLGGTGTTGYYSSKIVSDGVTSSEVGEMISSAISGVYTPKGTIAFASLPTASAGNLGWVYNISDAFTTTAAFAEGAGHSYGAGTNVVCVDAGDGAYQWDVLAGTIDLTELTADEVQSIWDSI